MATNKANKSLQACNKFKLLYREINSIKCSESKHNTFSSC